MRNTLRYPDGERWDRWGAQGLQLATEQPYCRQHPELELSLAQQVEKEPVLPAPGAGSAGIAGEAGYLTPRYKFTYKGCHSRVLLSLIFTFSPNGVDMSKYNSFFFLATWITQMVATLPYLVTERPDCHPPGIRVGRSVVPELHAAIVPVQEEVYPVLLLSCFREEVKSGDACAHAQWNPVSFAGDGEEGSGCGCWAVLLRAPAGVQMNVFRGATTMIDLCASFEPETI